LQNAEHFYNLLLIQFIGSMFWINILVENCPNLPL